MEPGFQLKEIFKLDDILFQKAYRIYEKAFPPELRIGLVNFAHILQTKKQGQDRHILVALFDEKVIGMATFNYLNRLNIGFVGYIVIDPQWENRGFGTKLYNSLIERLSLDAKRHGNLELDAIIFEVEKSELAKTNAQKQIDLRRIRFFKSVGGRIINAKYFQPSLGVGFNPVEMNLMVHITKTGLQVTGEWINAIVDCIYEDVYGMKSNSQVQKKNEYLKALNLHLSESELMIE